MLRLFVLGEIPGTSINLTFLQAMLLLGAFYYALYRHHERHHTQAPPTPEDIAL